MKQSEKDDVIEFVRYIKTLSEEEQQGLYLLTKGAAVMAGKQGIFEQTKSGL